MYHRLLTVTCICMFIHLELDFDIHFIRIYKTLGDASKLLTRTPPAPTPMYHGGHDCELHNLTTAFYLFNTY
jgi:hypothetical protein